MSPIRRTASIILAALLPCLAHAESAPAEPKPAKRETPAKQTAETKKRRATRNKAEPKHKPATNEQAEAKKAAKRAPPKRATARRPATAERTVATVEELGEKGYGYDFEDDPLHADSSAAHSARIRVRPHALRDTLIRPRLHFIPEMLKSVEDM